GIGLHPTSAGARVRLSEGKVSVTDGPFTEAKEVVGGFAIFDAPSKAEMLKWTTRFMDLHKKYLPGWEGECEVRQIAGPGEKLCDQTREAQAAAV
ncbi:MAG: YciI family protein, partial [Methyloceanibacter sp.]